MSRLNVAAGGLGVCVGGGVGWGEKEGDVRVEYARKNVQGSVLKKLRLVGHAEDDGQTWRRLVVSAEGRNIVRSV